MQLPTIAQSIGKFKETKNPIFLIRAAVLTVKQRRVTELAFGVWCTLFHHPSPVEGGSTEIVQLILRRFRNFTYDDSFFSRRRLIECFSGEFDVASLPDDFVGARAETIIRTDSLLIIGEYSDFRSARIAVVSGTGCTICDYYHARPGYFHIHCLWEYGGEGNILVSTGEALKVLDLWTVDGGKLRWVKRLRSRLAGHTAATVVRGKLFLGSDFSGRPNYMETLEGERYFFPAKAYDKYVLGFYPFFDRYVVSINTDLDELGNKDTLSIFDAIDESFLYCEYLERPDSAGSTSDTASPPCSIIGWRKGLYPADSIA